MSLERKIASAIAALVVCMNYACQRHISVTPASANPQAAAIAEPLIDSFGAEPATIASGQIAYLHWTTKNAKTIEISESIGAVGPDGQRVISPTFTTTYTLRAMNPTGAASASATITVARPLPSLETINDETNTRAGELSTQLRDIHFDDEGEIVQADRPLMEAAATELKNLFERTPSSPNIVLEAHWDQTTSAEYAMAIADRRAWIVKEAFVQRGVPSEKLQVVSYGQEQLLCQAATTICAAQNRRVHISRVP